MFEKKVELTLKKPKEILKIDIGSHRSKMTILLIETSKIYRATINNKGKTYRLKRDSDYLGADLKGLDLQGEN